MNKQQDAVDPDALLLAVARAVPRDLLGNITIVGSIASAWAFRGLVANALVATKDVDLLLTPSVSAVGTAVAIGDRLMAAGWTPQYRPGDSRASADTPADARPALRLCPPGPAAGWFIELLSAPTPGQQLRREWTSFETAHGSFALPSFRYLNIATHAPSTSAVGLKIAHPACMALAHLYEHADPDRTVISSIDPPTPRYVKDVGRAIALWWLAGQDGTRDDWGQRWQDAIDAETSERKIEPLAETRAALDAVAPRLADAYRLTKLSILAAHACELAAFRRAHASLLAAVRAA